MEKKIQKSFLLIIRKTIDMNVKVKIDVAHIRSDKIRNYHIYVRSNNAYRRKTKRRPLEIVSSCPT